MRRFPFPLLFSLLLLLPLAACDSNEDDNGDDNGDGTIGEFSATLGGDLDGTFSGNAFFSVVEDSDLPSDRAFILVMTDSDLTSETPALTEWIGIFRPGDRPEEGEYAIDNPDGETSETFGYYFNVTNQSTGVTMVGTSGSFTVTASSSDRVEGTFSFSGSLVDTSDPEAQGTGSVSGTFEAVFIDPDTAPDIPL